MTLALGASTALAVGVSAHLPPPAPGAAVLSSGELDVLAAVAMVLFPGVHFPINGVEAEVPSRVDALVYDLMEPAQLAGFRYVLRALEWGSFGVRGRRFTKLSKVEQLDVLATWSDPNVTPRRLAADSVRVFAGMAYFAHPVVQDALGYHTRCGVR